MVVGQGLLLGEIVQDGSRDGYSYLKYRHCSFVKSFRGQQHKKDELNGPLLECFYWKGGRAEQSSPW